MHSPIESAFPSHDDAELFYRHWPASHPGKKAVVLFHRGHEHSGRLQHIVDELGLPEDVDVFAWDARGHGRNAGTRGYAEDFGVLVRDCDCFIRHIEARHDIPVENFIVVAQSVGAVIASAWVHDYAPRIRAMALASPAFSVKLYVPLAVPALKLVHKLAGNFFVNSYVKSRFLTHDPERQRSYDADPLITRPISVNILLELYETAERVVKDAAAIRVPTLLLVSGDDFVVRKAPQVEFFIRLGSEVKRLVELPGFFHDTLGEAERERAFKPLRKFIAERFTAPMWEAQELVDAHQEGATFDEYRQLREPLPWWNPKAWNFAATRLAMRTVGQRLSRGVQVGVETGFDSGSMLDYVYRNTPEGCTPLGRLIDKRYLDAVGWRGIRQRRLNIIALLTRAIERHRAAGVPVRLVDVAAGHGRYVLDALRQAGMNKADSAVLRDYSELNVAEGTKLIESLGLQTQVRFCQGDAFDRIDLAALQPRPTIAVVSGLYELFPDNQLLNASLGGLAKAMEPGSTLLYTGQPWHPQLEFIARALSSHRKGEPWVMRRRTQLEMDEIVRAAGFRKVEQIADRWGIFTVSMAVRAA